MAYLNLDPHYPRHRKILRLKGLAGPEADVYPVRLWCYLADSDPEHGVLGDMSPQEIEAVVDWRGEPGKLVASMVRVGLLVQEQEVLKAAAWGEHQGHIIAFKRRAKAANESRWDRAHGRKPAVPVIKDSLNTNKESLNTNKESLKDTLLESPIPYHTNHTKPYHTKPVRHSGGSAPPGQPQSGIIGSAGLAAGLAAGTAKKPDDSFHRFMDRVLKDNFSLSPGDPDQKKRAAVAAGYRRFGKAGRDILAVAEGDPEKAYQAVQAIAGWLEDSGRSWSLDTIFKWTPDYLAEPGRFNGSKAR